MLQKAQDAIIQVDGIQVNRATNSFDDVVPGLTLTAKKVSDEAVRVTVSNQNSSIVSKVQAFVSAYNGLVKEIATQTAYDTDSQTAAALFGDSSLNNLVSQMRSAIAKNVKGLSGDYTSLSSIGISFAKDGSLELDSSKLTDALEADADAVKELFVEAGNSASSSVTMASTSSKTQVGTYSVSITSPATQATVTGTQVVPTSGIGASETLRFAYGEESMNVTLTAGMTLAQIISKLNTQFENNGYALKATDNGGCLQIHTTDYGSAETFTLSSTVDAGTSGQLGLGRSTITATGTDVEGEIGGIKATGKGQTLTASSVGKAAAGAEHHGDGPDDDLDHGQPRGGLGPAGPDRRADRQRDGPVRRPRRDLQPADQGPGQADRDAAIAPRNRGRKPADQVHEPGNQAGVAAAAKQFAAKRPVVAHQSSSIRSGKYNAERKHHAPYQMYQQVKITTADPLQIVVLRMKARSKNLNQWLMLIDTDADTASARLVRTQEIINYLRTSLDHARARNRLQPGAALQLHARPLIEVNLVRDRAKVQEVIGLLQTLLEGWHGISNRPKTGQRGQPRGRTGEHGGLSGRAGADRIHATCWDCA